MMMIGHKSTTSLAVYVANSKVQKGIASTSLSLIPHQQQADQQTSNTSSSALAKRKRSDDNNDDDNNNNNNSRLRGNKHTDNRKIFNININVTGKSSIKNLKLFAPDEDDQNNDDDLSSDTQSEKSDTNEE
jgi:hypothetical protein